MEILLDSARLRAVLEFAAKKEVRYYLVGVLVEILPTEVRYVATDGEAVGICRHRIEGSALPLELIIPRDVIVAACSAKSAQVKLALTDAGFVLGSTLFVPVDGKFPDYRRLFSAAPSGQVAQYQVAHLAKFEKARAALRAGDTVLRHNGEGPARVHFYGYDDFVGLVSPFLPIRAPKRPDLGMPEWGGLR